MSIPRLGHQLTFPPVAMARQDGLLAWGGDLRPERLLLAYASGIFPWFGPDDPILWYAPPERMVLDLDGLHIGRTLRKRLRQRPYRLTIDTAFSAVIAACATTPRPGQRGSWITPAMIQAYVELHRLGFAHSVEAWQGSTLVGGLYGVSLGAAFFGESMFGRADDASKIAFCTLVAELRLRQFAFVDCQVFTETFARLGARLVDRDRFQESMGRALLRPTSVGPWHFSTADATPPEDWDRSEQPPPGLAEPGRQP